MNIVWLSCTLAGSIYHITYNTFYKLVYSLLEKPFSLTKSMYINILYIPMYRLEELSSWLVCLSVRITFCLSLGNISGYIWSLEILLGKNGRPLFIYFFLACHVIYLLEGGCFYLYMQQVFETINECLSIRD